MTHRISYLVACMCISTASAHANTTPFGNNIHRYFWANYTQFTGDSKAANTWYQNIVHTDSSIYRYKGFIHFLFNEQRYAEIAALRPKVGTSFDNDPDIQLIFVQALRATGKNAEADTLVLTLADRFKTHLETVFEAAKTHIARKELESAITVIDNLLNTSPKKNAHFIFYFLKSQIYAQLDQMEHARTALHECTSLNPYFDKAWLLQAIMHEKQGDIPSAIEGYQKYMSTTQTPDIAIQQHLIELSFRSTKMQPIQSPIRATGMHVSSYDRAVYFFNRKQYRQAVPHIEQCLKKDPANGDYQTLMIQSLNGLKQYDKLADHVVAWIKLNPANSAPLELLHLMTRAGHPLEPIISVMERVHKTYPALEMPLLYLADFHMRTDQKTKALEYLGKASALPTLSAQLRTKVAYQRILLLYDAKQFDTMLTEAHAFMKEQEHSAILNLLAYFYATEKRDLAHAQTYISKALKNEPKNPHYLDTQAVIYIEQKEYAKAEAILAPLAQAHPHNAAIMTHLATAHKMQGNHQEALKIYTATLERVHSPEEKDAITQLIQQMSAKP